MASNTIFFENPRTGQMREAPVGFSWTTLFFGPLPMLFRGNWKWFAITLILAFVTVGLSNLVFMFMINSLHIKDLVADGFKAKSVRVGSLGDVSRSLGIMMADSVALPVSPAPKPVSPPASEGRIDLLIRSLSEKAPHESIKMLVTTLKSDGYSVDGLIGIVAVRAGHEPAMYLQESIQA